MALIDIGRVHPPGDRLGEIRDRPGVRRVLERQHHDAVLARRCPLAGEHPELPVLGGHEVVDGPRVHHDRIGDERLGGIAEVNCVDPVPDRGEVAVLAIGMEPEFRRGHGDRQPAYQGHGPPDIPRPHLHDRFRHFPGERGEHPVGAGEIGDERAIRLEQPVARAQGPFRNGVGDQPRASLGHEGERHHIAGPYRSGGRLEAHGGDRVGHHGDGQRRHRATRPGRDRRPARAPRHHSPIR